MSRIITATSARTARTVNTTLNWASLVCAIALLWVMALTLDSVGRFQLNANYVCYHEFTQEQRDLRCRFQDGGFGSLMVIGYTPDMNQ